MPPLKVNPNRMELMRLKRRMQVAQRGHKLLKDKLDELMKEFLQRIAANRRLRSDVEVLLREGYGLLAVTRAESGEGALDLALAARPAADLVTSDTRRVMSVTVPVFEIAPPAVTGDYSLASTPAVLDTALGRLAEAVPSMIQLAEREKAIELLAGEIERTRRRVNALEHVLMPQLSDAVRSIQMKLDEAERADLTRLMKVKDMVAAKNAPRRADGDSRDSTPPL